MFAEALAYALTPAPAWARRAGLLHQSVALAARYRRCRKAWDEHYAQCRAWVERAAAEADPGGTVVVFGSGPGHDLPLARLLARFQHVLLVDAIHPWRVRWQAWRHLGLECLTYDLSGRLNPAAVDFELPPDTRLALSLNILGQLPLAFPEDTVVRQEIIAQHLAVVSREVV